MPLFTRIRSNNDTQWQAVLERDELEPGDTAPKRESVLTEYYRLLAWEPAGEDNNRYPGTTMLENAEEQKRDLEKLLSAYNTRLSFKENKIGKMKLDEQNNDKDGLVADW